MKDQANVAEQGMYTGLITQERVKTRKSSHSMMINPQDNSFVYLELWATLYRMKNTGESFSVLSAVPSDGHLFFGALHPVGALHLSEDFSTEREAVFPLRKVGVIQNPAVGITVLQDITHDMRKMSPRTTKKLISRLFSCFHGFLFLCNRPVALVSYCCYNK